MRCKLFFPFAAVSLLLCLVTMPEAAAPQAASAAQPVAAAQPAKASATLPGQFVHAVKGITTPKEHLGFNLGDDYCLANYQQLISYWTKLAKESDRLKLVEIGKTEEGRPHFMGIVTSSANHKKLEHYKEVARKLAQSEGVKFDGGLHASESLCAQVLMETMYQYLAADDPETRRILDDVIILFVQANPDGMDLVADTYMKSSKDPKSRKAGNLGRLYQKYVGHDNNRDFYANTQAETKNMNRVMYREWFPQMVYNHHQTGPQGTVVFIPPCRDPNNYNIHPMVLNGIEIISTNMIQRLLAEGKPGATVRSGAGYSTWFNGGLSCTCQYHNMIGIFTETVGGPTPTNIPLIPSKLLPNGDYLAPITPQPWKFRQSLDYSVSGNKSLLDYASRHRSQLLYNIWRMGQDAIEAGNRDSWTITPKMVAAAGGGGGGGGFKKGAGGSSKDFDKFFRDPAKRDPRGYILPANQPDFPTATHFINTLLGNGIQVHRATADFEVAGKKYPKGSYVLKNAQAFRPHVIDMFEPQDHPNDIPYPGAGPKAPYDMAGWTLALQYGIKFDRIMDAFTAPAEEIKDLELPPPPASVGNAEGAVGFLLKTDINNAFRAVNRLHKAGQEVRRLKEPWTVDRTKHSAGTFYIPSTPKTLALLQKTAAELGTTFWGTKVAPDKEANVLKPVKIGLLDSGGGSMPSGWTRWILEKFEYDFKVIYNFNDPKLREKFDVLILNEGGVGGGGKGGGGFGKGGAGKGGAGKAGADKGAGEKEPAGGGDNNIANLKKFLDAGGSVLTIGGATGLGNQVGLGLFNHVAGLAREKYYIPYSVLQVRVDNTQPLAWGLEEHVDVMFSNSPTFKLPAEADKMGIQKVAWFDSKSPLRSGWAMGQENLENGVAMIDAKVGDGNLAMFGPLILFRGEPHGTFKLLFNGIARAGMK
jgi:Zinc carboxypeptidase